MESNVKAKPDTKIAESGEFFVSLKSGASFTLRNAELWKKHAQNDNDTANYYYFKRNKEVISFQAHKGKTRLDDVMEVIVKIS